MRKGCLVLGLTLLLGACLPAGAPQLVRDGAGIFSAAARAQAEARLQQLARRSDIWVLVFTGTNPDTPRLVREPMQLAEARGARAYALVISPAGLTGSSGNVPTADGGFQQLPNLDDVEVMLAAGLADDALAKIVDAAEAFAQNPDAAATPPPVPVDELPATPS